MRSDIKLTVGVVLYVLAGFCLFLAAVLTARVENATEKTVRLTAFGLLLWMLATLIGTTGTTSDH